MWPCTSASKACTSLVCRSRSRLNPYNPSHASTAQPASAMSAHGAFSRADAPHTLPSAPGVGCLSGARASAPTARGASGYGRSQHAAGRVHDHLTGGPIRHAPPARSHQPGRRRDDHRRFEAVAVTLMNPSSSTSCGSASHGRRTRSILERTAATGRRSRGRAREPHRLEPVLVLRRRGARDDAVLRARARLRVPGRGGLPHDPAGRRGAPRAALQPLLRAGARLRRDFEDRLDAGARRPQRRLPRALRRAPRRSAATACSPTPPTARPRSTSSRPTTWSSRARSR